jgi:tetratricopeptide (TPR) repeat protein
MEDPSSSTQARFLRGMIFFERSAYDQATRELEILRTNIDLGEQVLYVLVEGYRQLGKVRESHHAFVDLRQRYPDSAFGHKLMGMAYAHEARYEEAVKEFTEALETKPDLPEAAFALGYIYFEQRQHMEARRWLEKELTIQPCFAKAHYYLGEIERIADDWAAAARRFQKAQQCDPNYGESYLGLGQYHVHRGELEKAVVVLKRAADLKPDDTKVRYWLARVLRSQGHSEEAEAELSRVKQIHSESYGKASAKLDRHNLTLEEKQILSWVLQGKDSLQIARQLAVSLEAAEARLDELIRRFNVKDRDELALYALSHGLLPDTPQQPD